MLAKPKPDKIEAPVSAETAVKSPNVSPTTKNVRKLALVGGVAILLLGSSAAAYFGVIKPNNKPENVLKQALENTLSQKRTSFDGNLSYEFTKDDNPLVKALTLTFNGQGDLEKNNAGVSLEVATSGVKVPLEIRRLGTDFYVKIGDIGSLIGAAGFFEPNVGVSLQQVSNSVSDKWIEIDQSLLKQFKADCALGTPLALTDDDVRLLLNAYQKSPFATIKSTQSEKLNGKAAIRYELDINTKQAGGYSNALTELTPSKKLKNCYPALAQKAADNSLATSNTMPLTLWVDKTSKTIAKIAIHTTPGDEQKEGIKGSLEINTHFGKPVNITKPANTKPLIEIINELTPVILQFFGKPR